MVGSSNGWSIFINVFANTELAFIVFFIDCHMLLVFYFIASTKAIRLIVNIVGLLRSTIKSFENGIVRDYIYLKKGNKCLFLRICSAPL